MLFANDEHDKDRDEEEDADLDDENSEDEDSDDEDKDDDSDSDDEKDSDEEDDSEDDDEDEDNKPVTRKELRELLKSNQNKRNAADRVSKKKGQNTKQPSETDKRLAALEQSHKERMLLEKKLDFASEHGLSKKQVNYVFKLTNRPTPKFLNKPHVKAALDAIKSQEGVARNTPSSSGKRFKSPGGKKWTELSSEERQANLADRRASILASKR
jgi:hypothetical protein